MGWVLGYLFTLGCKEVPRFCAYYFQVVQFELASLLLAWEPTSATVFGEMLFALHRAFDWRLLRVTMPHHLAFHVTHAGPSHPHP